MSDAHAGHGELEDEGEDELALADDDDGEDASDVEGMSGSWRSWRGSGYGPSSGHVVQAPVTSASGSRHG